MSKKALLVIPVAVGALAIPASAHAVGTLSYSPKIYTCKASITAHPENSSPAWAIDSFTRTTKIRYATGGNWAVRIHDSGTFTTVKGVKSDSGDLITNKVTGHFSGVGDFTAKSKYGHLTCDQATEHFSGTKVPSTSTWVLHLLPKGATTPGITNWEWTYSTGCQWMIETEKGVSGHMSGDTSCPVTLP